MAYPLPFLVFMTCLMITLGTDAMQSSHTDLLQQIRRLLEYPKVLEVWNKTDDFCFMQSMPLLSVVCEGYSVVELKIIGDKLSRAETFNGHFLPGKTLSEAFVVDSLITTLTRLTTLRVVVLVSLGIWGPFPDKIHRLYSLEVLDLSSNFLYGSIPPKLSAMRVLKQLTLDYNYFNGTVPDWFNSCANLTVLNLRNNRFEGTISPSIGKIMTLTELSLSGNNISGPMPDMSSLINLKMLNLRDNAIDHQLPRMPKGLVTMLLSGNLLSNEIPQEFTELTQLQHLDLSYNFLVGTPPQGLFSLPNISYLNLASNMLSGSFSRHTNCSSQLDFVDLSDNLFVGDLPACLNTNSSVRTVKLNGNCLSIDSQTQHMVKHCQKSQMSEKKFKSKGATLLVALVIGGTGFVALLVLFIYAVLFRKICTTSTKQQQQQLLHNPAFDNSSTKLSSELLANTTYISGSAKLGTEVSPLLRVFSVEELKEATKNFDRSSFIGEGTIGKLYKGRLENGTVVAIRCLSLFKKYTRRNLRLRLDLLSKLRHQNLVCLLGHCIDCSPDDFSANRVFLIYEHIPNGTLHDFLSKINREQTFRWQDRLQALIGISKAIQYLHTSIIPGSTNNRIKTSSILLDRHCVSKLSDYGLSILMEEIYDVEMVQEGLFGESNFKAVDTNNFEDDIYSFGYILLEVLIGPSLFQKREAFGLRELILRLSGEEECKRILDATVRETTSSWESVATVIAITSKCLSAEASGRPTIEEVLWNLQYAAQVDSSSSKDDCSPSSSSS